MGSARIARGHGQDPQYQNIGKISGASRLGLATYGSQQGIKREVVNAPYAKAAGFEVYKERPGGRRGMRGRISNTAAYGGLTRGPRLVTDETRETLRAILGEIRSGRFAEEWIAEQRGGKKRLEQLKSEEAAHPSETAGARVRAMVHGRIQSA